LRDREREREIEGEGDVSGGLAAAGEDARDVGEGFFLESKQRGSDFWVSNFSDFEFRLMGTEFLGRKSLRKPYGYRKILLGS
jgi:hypothetical protein